jgi:molecular chaperone HtpG
MNAHMERVMRAMNQEVPKSKRILEINPDHKLIREMNKIADSGGKKEKLEDYTDLLYYQALLTEGSAPKDPARFAKLLSELMIDNG